jgi:Fur family ferric uptake transcriptional regulator
MTTAATSPTSDALREELRAVGLRATNARLLVLDAMHAVRGPVSHGELATTLADRGLDRVTVYRNLVDLTDAGLLRRTDLGDHTWRFELAATDAHDHATASDAHPHFLCDACGDVTCLPDEAVQIVAGPGTPQAIARRRFEIQIKGRCDRCT